MYCQRFVLPKDCERSEHILLVLVDRLIGTVSPCCFSPLGGHANAGLIEGTEEQRQWAFVLYLSFL